MHPIPKLLGFLAVGLGGALGSMMRYGITLISAAAGISGIGATLAVNALGSFLIGLFSGLCTDSTALLLLTVGLCGGFTTYSTFALQNVKLFQEGKPLMAVLYVIGTVVSCVLLAWLGNRIAK